MGQKLLWFIHKNNSKKQIDGHQDPGYEGYSSSGKERNLLTISK
jgi:hypothetical protein